MENYRFEIASARGSLMEYANSLNDTGKEFVYKGLFEDPNNGADEYLCLHIPVGKTKIIYDGSELIFELIRYSDIVGTNFEAMRREELFITISARSKEIACEIFKKFIINAVDYNRRIKPETNRRAIFKTNAGWIYLPHMIKSNMNTVYIDQTKKQQLINDVTSFENNKQEYIKYGIPHTRKYLFEGPHGSGKSFLINALASHFNKNLAMISFTPDLDEAYFIKAITTIENSFILVIEDIDLIFSNKQCGITLNGILNIFDGFGRKEDMIIIMTSNNYDQMEDIYKRPGVLDFVMNFTAPTKQQVNEMFLAFFPKQEYNFKKFYDNVSSKKTSMALFHKFFFENRNCENILDKMNEFFTLLLTYSKKDHGLYS